ncbi:MAG: epoxide hydrolase-like predicted phosphatase [Candidatus Azotimanducaceae bacterium]|jgi:epoxide hydrolase-like predicted phosphatase
MTINALLFDLGNVLIDIDFERIFKKWSHYSGVPTEVIRAEYEVDAAYKQHERGEIEGREYHHHLAKKLKLDISYDQFCEGWNDIMIAPIDQTVDIIRSLKERIPMYVLSNANTLHKRHWESTYQNELSHFEKIYVSSDIGCRKPEPESYQHVLNDIGIAAENIAFFDDLIENVDAANALGINAVHVKSSSDVEKFINAHF